jgi:hypothetical protein
MMKKAWLDVFVEHLIELGVSPHGEHADLLVGGIPRRRAVRRGGACHEHLGEVARHGEEAPLQGRAAVAALPLGGDGRPPRRLPRRRGALRGRRQDARGGRRRDEAAGVEDGESRRRGSRRCHGRGAARVAVLDVITSQRHGDHCLRGDAAGVKVDAAASPRHGAHCRPRRDAAGVGSVFSFRLSAARPRRLDTSLAIHRRPDHGQFRQLELEAHGIC